MERPDLSKLAGDYNSFHNSLRERGYSHFERGIIYTGLAFGMFAPVAAARYGIFPETSNGWTDLGYWAASVALNAMSSAVAKGVPLVYTGGAGAFILGFPPAFTLKMWRERRRKRKAKRIKSEPD